MDGKRREAYTTTLPYAAQTFWGVNDRIVSIPWIRSLNKNKLYTGAMGIPRELMLIESNHQLVLSQLENGRNKKYYNNFKREICVSNRNLMVKPEGF